MSPGLQAGDCCQLFAAKIEGNEKIQNILRCLFSAPGSITLKQEPAKGHSLSLNGIHVKQGPGHRGISRVPKHTLYASEPFPLQPSYQTSGNEGRVCPSHSAAKFSNVRFSLHRTNKTKTFIYRGHENSTQGLFRGVQTKFKPCL